MKQLLFIYLTFISYYCLGQNNEVVIKGKIKGTVPEKIGYSIPVQGKYFWNFAKYIQPDSLGCFQISFKIEYPCFVNIYKTEANPSIIVEPNKTYEIEIDQNSHEVNIISSIKTIQEFYSGLLRLNPRACDNPISSDTSDINIIIVKLNRKLQEEISNFSNSYSKNEITEEIYELLKLDREVYYKSAQATLAAKNYIKTKNDKVGSKKMLELMGNTVQSISLTNPYFLRANYAYDFISLYIEYNSFNMLYNKEYSETYHKISNDYLQKDLRHHRDLYLAEQFLTGEILEFYKASYLHLNSFRDSKEILSLLEKFQIDYPESIYHSFLESKMNDLSERLRHLEKN
ncbi:MAG: hypothetical protein AB7S48_00775 [Bacteroidales bacterium]